MEFVKKLGGSESKAELLWYIEDCTTSFLSLHKFSDIELSINDIQMPSLIVIISWDSSNYP